MRAEATLSKSKCDPGQQITTSKPKPCQPKVCGFLTNRFELIDRLFNSSFDKRMLAISRCQIPQNSI